MPQYTYKCKTCGREIEETHSIHDDAHDVIPHISAKEGYQSGRCLGPMERLITGAPAISWKGGAPTPKHYE